MKWLSVAGTNKKKIQVLSEKVASLEQQVREASDFISEIEKGNFAANISSTLANGALGNSLASMKVHLDKIASEEEKRNWLNTGLARFSDILRNKQSLSLKDLSDDILSNLIKYIGANQGAIFMLEGEEKAAQYLEMISCYAYSRKKYLQKRIEPGQGLVGQCMLEQQPIYLKVIPSDYISITSGLGEATPRSLFICPLMINENIFGVIELASLYEFQQHHLDFVNKLSENVAASIKNVKDSERTINLLNASQQQAEELRAQEEEMRQNLEEMQATQEEMKRQSDELSRTTTEMTGIISGINATMATIEFHPDGTIIKANNNFLKTMKYTLEDIKGRHHRIFAPKEVLESSEYKSFWSRLASGQSMTGTFKRVASTGETVWLNAIYNPTFNARGEVVKVVKFATDITEQQEMLAESKGIMKGINATMATIEFLPDGTILNANDNFLKAMKCSLDEIKGKHHRIFASKEVVESVAYQTFWKRLAAGESTTGTFKRLSATGETVWLNAIYNPIMNANGDVVKVVKFAIDITEQQESLAQSKGVMNGINATMATIEFLPDGTILDANENFLKTMKCSLHEIRGKHHKIFVPKDVLASADYQKFWISLAAGQSTTGTFKRLSATGEIVWLNAIYNPIMNANGDVVKVVKFATDITEQQEALAESKGVLEGINATMATIEFQPDGTIIHANDNFLKTMNCTLDEIRGKHHKIFVPLEVLVSEEYEKFWTSLAAGKPTTGTFKRISATGETVWLNAIYNPILNANGDVVKVVKFATDVTQLQHVNTQHSLRVSS